MSSRLSVARARAVGSSVDVAMVDPADGGLEWRSCHRTSPHGESAFIVCKQSSRGPRIGRVALLPSSREHTMVDWSRAFSQSVEPHAHIQSVRPARRKKTMRLNGVWALAGSCSMMVRYVRARGGRRFFASSRCTPGTRHKIRVCVGCMQRQVKGSAAQACGIIMIIIIHVQ